jgi:cysteine desulfuration protein SufE
MSTPRLSLCEKQRELIDDLNLIEDRHERLAALADWVARTRLPDDLQEDGLIVPGCVSRVWVHGAMKDGLTHFRAAADSPMVAGLVAVLCDLYSGVSPAEVVGMEPELWARCGFTKMLSPTRLNGLSAVRTRLKELAASWLS